MKLYDIAKLDRNGYEEDVCDTDIDMLVALDWDSDYVTGDNYQRFIDFLVKNVDVTGNGAYGPICDFTGLASKYVKPLRAYLKSNCNQDAFEFDFDDETEYAFVEWLEGLIAGYESETTYGELLDQVFNV